MFQLMDNLPVLSCLHDRHAAELHAELRKRGYTVFVLNGNRILNADTFFAEVGTTLPVDPPLGSGRSWDALVDSVGEGLDNLGEGKFAIIWERSDRMLDASMCDFLTAVDCLKQVAIESAKGGHTVNCFIFLMGDRPSYEAARKFDPPIPSA